jgi:hypothetical protein
MKRTCTLACQRLPLLLLLLLTITQPVKAERSNQAASRYVIVTLKTLDFPHNLCQDQKINLKFGYQWKGPPPLIPINVSFKITAQGGSYTSSGQPKVNVQANTEYAFSVSYKAGKKLGPGSLSVAVLMAGRKGGLQTPITFEIMKCEDTIQYNVTKPIPYGFIIISNDYYGSGSLGADDNGQVTGSGTVAIASEILPFSEEGASCQYTISSEGSSGISFSGQMGDAGESQVTMDLEALSVSAGELTCTKEDYTGSMTFPAYNYGSCQVMLAGIGFEAETLDVPFDCPGEEPVTIPITVIPRRGA